MSSQQEQDSQGNGRDKLLQAAVQLFARNGYDGTSVRELAAEAGVSTALIRKYFGSKQGLHEAADAYVLERFRRYTEDIFAGAPDEPMLGMAERAVRFSQQQGGLLAAYLRYALGDPSVRGGELVDKYRSVFFEQIARLRERGQLADGVDERWAAYILMFLQMGPMMLEPYVRLLDGVSMYEPEQISARNAAYFELLRASLIRPRKRTGREDSEQG